MPRVTLQQAADHLLLPIVLDATPLDPRQNDLALKLLAAEAIIVDYLKIPPPQINPLAAPPRIFLPPDETAPPDPPPAITVPPDDDPIVQAAILLELGELWRFRGDDASGQNAGQDATATLGQLSPTITNLLRRYRDPACA